MLAATWDRINRARAAGQIVRIEVLLRRARAATPQDIDLIVKLEAKLARARALVAGNEAGYITR